MHQYQPLQEFHLPDRHLTAADRALAAEREAIESERQAARWSGRVEWLLWALVMLLGVAAAAAWR